MDIQDMYVGSGLIVLIFGLFHRLFYTQLKGDKLHAYFFTGLGLKFLGAIALGIIYQFHYNGMDTFEYFQGARSLSMLLKTDFSTALQVFFSDGVTAQEYCSNGLEILDKHMSMRSSFLFVKLLAFLSFLSFDSYIGIALLVATFSFWGTWKLYRAVVYHFDLSPNLTFGVLFLLPMPLIWGSGLLKDTLVLGAFFWGLSVLLSFKEKKEFLVLLLCLLIVGLLKIYLLLCLVPVLILSVFHHRILEKDWPIPKLLGVEFVLVFIIGFILLKAPNLLGGVGVMDTEEQLLRVIKDGQAWNARDGQSSAYHFEGYERSLTSVFLHFPDAVTVSLFRPFLWEMDSPMKFVMGLESLLLLLLTIFVFLKGRLKVLTVIYQNPVIYFAINFSIAYAFWLGIATYNFGALSRYRIVLVPLFLLGLMAAYKEVKVKR